MTRWPLRVSANASFQKETSAVGLRGDDEKILPGFWMSLAFFQPKIVECTGFVVFPQCLP